MKREPIGRFRWPDVITARVKRVAEITKLRCDRLCDEDFV
jgi:hypothetical protein